MGLMEKLRNWVICSFLKESFQQIEKIDFITPALEKLYQQKLFKDRWSDVLDHINEVLQDAQRHVYNARSWK